MQGLKSLAGRSRGWISIQYLEFARCQPYHGFAYDLSPSPPPANVKFPGKTLPNYQFSAEGEAPGTTLSNSRDCNSAYKRKTLNA